MNEYVVKVDDVIHNINLIKELAKTQIIGVLKGNGYGFGMDFMANLLKDEGITSFAVTEVTDAEYLRVNVLDETDELLVMRSTCLPDEAEIIVKNKCIATVGSLESARVLNETAKQLDIRCKANIKIDTGLSRYGFTNKELDKITKVYEKSDYLDFVGIYTHFSSAFTQKEQTKSQLKDFQNVVNQLKEKRIDVGKVYAASSPAIFNVEDTALDAVRIGSAFTGRVITEYANSLKKVGFLRSQVIEIKKVPNGTAVGYSGSFVTKADTTLAIVPIGHFEGFGLEKAQNITGLKSLLRQMLSPLKKVLTNEHLSVKINGNYARVVGAVGLTHSAIDVTGLDANVGDTVEIDISPLMVNSVVKRVYE